ncbi:MAG: 2-hydroxyacyl-CoA dehydratase [Deltaproteobacteria bacterium]|nr:2-hydroxyacyl-CoA dehydratase [Deltaproteobacteria bacterium]
MESLAQALLNKQPCARTLTPDRPGHIADDVLAQALKCKARGVIAHTVKFCDPYLARLPLIRKILKEAGIPFLHIEGDGTQGIAEQYKTRIRAFVEMLQ